MASEIPREFSEWLNEKLKDLNTDEAIFGSYIAGILDSDETNEEKHEGLEEILSEIIQNADELSKFCEEIIEKWHVSKANQVPIQSTRAGDDIDTKLGKLLESQSLATQKTKEYTAEEKKIRDAILSQYSQMSDDEEQDEEDSVVGSSASAETKENGLEKNLNFHAVQQAEKEKREQAKVDSQKKKEKDKEDREKQKQLKEDKKEKRKTQKGERKR